jgi:hypothetical protein
MSDLEFRSLHPERDRARGGSRLGPLVVLTLVLIGGLAAWRWSSVDPERSPVGEFDSSQSRASSPTPGATIGSEPDLAESGCVPSSVGTLWKQWDDPQSDGWKTEIFGDHAKHQLLDGVRALLRGAEAAEISKFVEEDVRTSILTPEAEPVFDNGNFRVWRSRADDGIGVGADSGIAAIAAAFARIRERFLAPADARVEVKIFRIATPGPDDFRTTAYVAISGATADGRTEVHGTWQNAWRHVDSDHPRIASFLAESIEQTTYLRPSPLFSDITEAVFAGCESWETQILTGLDEWAGRIQDNRYFSLSGTPGLAIGDVNGDGLDDLYLCQEGGLPNRLFIRTAEGTMRDASAGSGADWVESTRSALLVDLDGDGKNDLAAAVYRALVLAKGDGAGRFSVRAALPTSSDTMSLSASDFDRDGDLDLYLCAYNADDISTESGPVSLRAAEGFVYHDSNDGAPNVLFRNDSPRSGAGDADWLFVDATAELGLDVNNRRYSFAAAWEDFDRDGDQDLYVANDFGRNNLYRSDRADDGSVRFVDVAVETGSEDSASGMSVSWGDYNRDGWPDIYVGNMFSSAGGRIAFQPSFKPEAREEVRTRIQRFARGNTLLENLEGKRFADESEFAGVTMGRWAWSSSFVDIDSDGWEDLLVANGYITTEDSSDL